MKQEQRKRLHAKLDEILSLEFLNKLSEADFDKVIQRVLLDNWQKELETEAQRIKDKKSNPRGRDLYRLLEKQNEKCFLSGVLLQPSTTQLIKIDPKGGVELENLALIHRDLQGLKNLSQEDRLKYAHAIVSHSGKSEDDSVAKVIDFASEVSGKALFKMAKAMVDILGKEFGYKVVKK